MALDMRLWRLPTFVSHGCCRDTPPEPLFVERAMVFLNNGDAAKPGLFVNTEVHLFGELGWGKLQGRIEEVRDDGRIVVPAVRTTFDPPELDHRWQTVLRFDPEAFDGAWIVEHMSAEGVLTVPRLWPRWLIERLRAEELLVYADSNVGALLELARAAPIPHATMPLLHSCAAFTARALVNAFDASPLVEESFADVEAVATRLEELWA